jgi:hypothetical protein
VERRRRGQGARRSWPTSIRQRGARCGPPARSCSHPGSPRLPPAGRQGGGRPPRFRPDLHPARRRRRGAPVARGAGPRERRLQAGGHRTAAALAAWLLHHVRSPCTARPRREARHRCAAPGGSLAALPWGPAARQRGPGRRACRRRAGSRNAWRRPGGRQTQEEEEQTQQELGSRLAGCLAGCISSRLAGRLTGCAGGPDRWRPGSGYARGCSRAAARPDGAGCPVARAAGRRLQDRG